jgi:hypothetical protein
LAGPRPGALVRGRFTRPKSRASRRLLEVGERTVELLQAHWQESKFQEEDHLVFCHPEKGRPLDPSRLSRTYLKRALRKARIKVPFRPFHDLRHTALTHEAAAGNPQAYVQMRAGHSQGAITERYIHAAQVLFPDAAQRGEDRLFGRLQPRRGEVSPEGSLKAEPGRPRSGGIDAPAWGLLGSVGLLGYASAHAPPLATAPGRGSAITGVSYLPPFGFRGIVVPAVSWAGTRFHAVVRPNWEEICRREQRGLGPITDHALLRALDSLPVGTEVSWQSIDPVVAAFLDCAPEGILQTSDAAVRVDLQPPLELVGAFTVSRHWGAVNRVGILVTAAPTGVLLRHRPRRLDEAMSRARRFGIGLALRGRRGIELLTQPVRRTRPSLSRRKLLETLYGRWCYGTGTPMTSHHEVSCLEGG